MHSLKESKRSVGREPLSCAAILLAAVCVLAVPANAAPGYDQAAASTIIKEIGKYGMTPVSAADIQDGIYAVDAESSSSFFRIEKAELTVTDGSMEAVLTMSSSSYLYVYPGTAAEAAAAPLEDYIPLEEQDDWPAFTIPVQALNKEIDCAAYSKKKEKWYDRKLIFDASSLPAEAVDFTLPDYERIEAAIKLYDKTNGTDTRAEQSHAEESTAAAGSDSTELAPEPVIMEEKDGEYSIEVSMTGGSERASVSSPTWLYVREGKGYARLLWSSVYYDYMIVDGKKYLNETTDGSNSTFTIPVTALDEPMQVIADTTAMGDPLEIAYALTFYSDTVGSKGSIPQEAAKRVLTIAILIILIGGLLNHYVKRKRC